MGDTIRASLVLQPEGLPRTFVFCLRFLPSAHHPLPTAHSAVVQFTSLPLAP